MSRLGDSVAGVAAHAEVAVFVTRSDGSEILLVHRSPGDGAYWHVVAGAIEHEESDDEAAMRELLEEVGLAAEVGDAFRIVEWAFVDDSRSLTLR